MMGTAEMGTALHWTGGIRLMYACTNRFGMTYMEIVSLAFGWFCWVGGGWWVVSGGWILFLFINAVLKIDGM